MNFVGGLRRAGAVGCKSKSSWPEKGPDFYTHAMLSEREFDATTRLLEEGIDAVQLATAMVEVCAVVGGDKADKILELVASAEKNGSRT